jgi:predicted Rossmann fold flavoprotein
LQISSYWQQHDGKQPITIELLPEIGSAAWLAEHRQGRQTLEQLLAQHLPKRFAQAWCALHGWHKPLAEYSNQDFDTITRALQAWTLMPTGTLGYNKAEVTLGGVDTRALSSKTMQAESVPGLFFIGEVVDVTGWLGGYNFQWAWSSGWAAGQAV